MKTSNNYSDPFSRICQHWNDMAHAKVDSNARAAIEGVSSRAGKSRPASLFRRLMASFRLA